MTEITKIIRTETGHRLTNYKGRCAHLHGHSYEWHVTVAGEANNNGMVMDFKDLKEILKKTIDSLDHAFVMHTEDPILKILGVNDTVDLFLSTDGEAPRLHIVPFNPTVENLVKWQFSVIQNCLSPFKDITLTSIKCWETADSFCEVCNG